MEITFNYKLWGLIVFFSLLLAIGVVALMYFRNPGNKDLRKWQLWILRILRFFSVFFIAFFFTGPLIKTIKRITQPPTVIMAVDNSRSMTGLDETGKQKELLTELINKISEGLKEHYDLVTYTFSTETEKNGIPVFDGKMSDYSGMLETLFNNHFNENIGAMVIVGDGRYNQGENPANLTGKFNFPLYTLGTGDTSGIQDISIADLRVNRTAFSGNKFPVEADIRITGFQGKTIRFDLFHQGEKVFTRSITSIASDFFITIPVMPDATGKGLQYYSAVVEILPGDQNRSNNTFPFAINVLENKQKIMILSHGAHPDAGALKDALEKQVNYEVSLVTAPPYPADLSAYNLLVLNQIPSSSESGQAILAESAKHRIPLLMIVGTQTFLPQFNALALGAEITPRAGDFEEAQATLNEHYALFTFSDALKEILGRFPPLKVPFAQYNLNADYQAVAWQRIKNIVTPAPLMATGSLDGRKMGIIFGEGIWRWRLYNYTLSGSHAEFNELMDKMVQYLALRDNEDNFIVDFKPVYNETEPILMTAEVYTDAYEMVNTPEVTITVTDSTQREFPYVFDRSGRFYRLNAGIFPPGRYSFMAETTLGTADYSESGAFAVMPVQTEMNDLQANHGVLYRLSYETKGSFFPAVEADQLLKEVVENNTIRPVNYFQTALNEMLNLRWIFLILLGTLGAEWFLRKFWGIY